MTADQSPRSRRWPIAVAAISALVAVAAVTSLVTVLATSDSSAAPTADDFYTDADGQVTLRSEWSAAATWGEMSADEQALLCDNYVNVFGGAAEMEEELLLAGYSVSDVREVVGLAEENCSSGDHDALELIALEDDFMAETMREFRGVRREVLRDTSIDRKVFDLEQYMRGSTGDITCDGVLELWNDWAFARDELDAVVANYRPDLDEVSKSIRAIQALGTLEPATQKALDSLIDDHQKASLELGTATPGPDLNDANLVRMHAKVKAWCDFELR